ncbi:MAG: hypothetical protein AAF414_21345 [Pseudomonadota bacterium]
MSFSAISEAVVLFSVPAVFWHMMMVQVAGRASIRQMVVVSAIMLAWTAYAYAVVRYGFGQALFGDTPAQPVLYVVLAGVLTWVFRRRLLGDGVPQQLLIGLQLFRVIGLVFVLEYSRGALPGSFALPAGWGDFAAALVALAVLIRYPRGTVPGWAVILVATVGLADFASAFFFGFTSAASPLQLFAFDNPNRVAEYPLGLIPFFLVPYAIMAHLLSLAQLGRDRRRARRSPMSDPVPGAA